MSLEDALANSILALGDLEEHRGPRGPFFVRGARTVAYWVDPAIVEVRLGKEKIEQLRSRLERDPRAIVRKPGSVWVGVRVRTRRDVDLVVDLVRGALD